MTNDMDPLKEAAWRLLARLRAGNYTARDLDLAEEIGDWYREHQRPVDPIRPDMTTIRSNDMRRVGASKSPEWCNCQAPSRAGGPWHPLGDTPHCPLVLHGPECCLDCRAGLPTHPATSPDTGQAREPEHVVTQHWDAYGGDVLSRTCSCGEEWTRDEERCPQDEPQAAEEPQCQKPPAGWVCSRDPGHDGPCAARRAVSR